MIFLYLRYSRNRFSPNYDQTLIFGRTIPLMYHSCSTHFTPNLTLWFVQNTIWTLVFTTNKYTSSHILLILYSVLPNCWPTWTNELCPPLRHNVKAAQACQTQSKLEHILKYTYKHYITPVLVDFLESRQTH